MSTITHIAAPPPGFRFMSAHEAECLGYGEPIVLWNGTDKEHALVYGHTDEAMNVTLRSGAKLRLDLDHPDYWGRDESRDRRPPNDGEWVAIKETGATADADLEPMLRVSVAMSELMKTDEELAKAVIRVREILHKRIRGQAA